MVQTIFKKVLLWVIPFVFVTVGYAADKYVVPADKESSLKEVGAWINSRFELDTDKVRCIYYWVAHRINYDMKSVKIKTYYTSADELAQKTFVTKKGVCQGFSEVFRVLCESSGITCAVIAGYTRSGTRIEPYSHAWVGVKINDVWLVCDPTWASGSAVGNKYVRRFTWDYCLVEPAVAIKTHMPFDPMWQFCQHPITHKMFAEKRFVNSNPKIFAFNDTINMVQHLGSTEKYRNQVARITRYGLVNPLIKSHVANLQELTKTVSYNQSVSSVNEAIDFYNQGIKSYNKYILFKNNRFKPEISPKALVAMVDDFAGKFSRSAAIFNATDESTIKDRTTYHQVKKSVREMMSKVAEERDFVNRYLKSASEAKPSEQMKKK